MTRSRDSKGRFAQQNVGAPWILPNREPTPELLPQTVSGISGQPGVYDEIMAGHPKVAKHMKDLRVTLGAARYWWQPVEDETTDEADFREDLEALTAHAYLDAENGVQGVSEIAESWLQYWAHGMYWAEVRFVEEPTEPRRYAYLTGRQLEIYPVHPSTVQQVLQADNYRRLTGIRQNSSTGFAEIPVDRLLWVQNGGIVGQYTGESILRPLVFLFDRWKSIWLSSEQQAYMQGGCLVLMADSGATHGTDAWKRANHSLKAWQNNLARYLLLPPGFKADFIQSTATIDGDTIDRIDAYCDTVLGAQVAALIASANGHRALGEVAAQQDDTSESEDLSAFLRRLGDRLSRWIAARVAYTGRRPRFCIRPAEPTAAPTEKVTAATAAKAAGAVTWTPADESWIRTTIGMPELQTESVDVEGGEEQALLPDPAAAPAAPVPTDPAAAPSAPMADEGDTPPAQVQQSAADGLYARGRSTAEMRGLQNRTDLMLAKKLAAGQSLTRGELRYIESALRFIGDPTVKPDYGLHGPTYQEFHGLGGQAMIAWLGGVLADVDATAPVDAPDAQLQAPPIADGGAVWQ
jgi:hypothetical protein